MTHTRCTVMAVLLGFCTGPLFAREWTDSSGAFRLDAELVSVKNEKVYLERSDGEVVSVPLERLSEKDLRYLASLPEHRDYFKEHPIPGVHPIGASGPKEANAGLSARPALGPVGPDWKPGEVCRFGDLRWGVQSLAFSPDGRFLAAGKTDRAVMLFDIEKKRRVAFVEKLEDLGKVTAVCFSPDGRLLLTGGYTGRIQVWNVSQEGVLTEAHRFVGHTGAVQTITVSRDGSHVLSGGDDKTAHCWTLKDGRGKFAIDGFTGAVKATFITRGGKQGLCCDGDVIVLIDMLEGKAIQSMKLGKRSAQAVAIAPNGSLVVAQDTYALVPWEIKSGSGLPLFQDREIQWFAAFLPNSKYLLSGGRGKVNVWDVATHQKIYEFDTVSASYVQTIACSPDNRYFAAIPGSAGRDLQVFRLPAEATVQ